MTRDYRWMQLHDGELDPAEESVLRARALQDPRARAELDGFRRTSDLLREVYAGQPDPALTDLILARVRSSAETRARAGLAIRPAFWARRTFGTAVAGVVVVAAAAAAFLVLGLGSQPTGSESRQLGATPLESATGPRVIAQSASEQETGVSIQTVDFGSTQGAIFLVSEGGLETPVIWTLEDAKDKG